MADLKKKITKRLGPLIDLGIITAYEGIDWASELIAKLFPGVGEIPDEAIDQVANIITLGMLAAGPYAYDKLGIEERPTRDEYIDRMKEYGKAGLIEAGQILPFTDFIPAYHWAWLNIYYPNVAEGIKSFFKLRNLLRRPRGSGRSRTAGAYA